MPHPIPTTDLAPPLRQALKGHDVIVFDGECVLCSRFFRFVLRHDKQSRFRFVTAQSPLGQALYGDLGLPTDDFETNLVIVNNQIHQRLNAFAAAMSALGWPWRVLASARYVPEPLSSTLYHAIARRRYRIFGRYDHCMIPTPEVRDRFLDLPRAA
ncbi:thiol-disulfide oxidoreductase [Jannaschia pagri]|uniref:Thiol-disulfide oxidoreductase n=1 Tax=Jannaschia pagri TaxID=2829797 RepID=A0ABQ4NHZ9_9RHOB|nr:MULTISPECIES: DCC1-like thiol-disulfide oxidoreductase family protein [unclassified Jannaschia]GIT89962.1 thiol-disulfide oxidoreductase [Jannaschia sp. AI_61]GIT93931.1 thiol-disulfide oxidoreductase [Jannaschia sp. AI_62]